MAKKGQNLKIGFKLLSIISLISIAIIVSNILIYNSFVDEFKRQKKTFSIYHPSIVYLEKIKEMNINSISLTKNWVFIDKDTGTVQKKQLMNLHDKEYPQLLQDMKWLVENWEKEEQNLYFDLLSSMDSLKNKQMLVMDKLSFFEDYNDPQIMFEIIPLISEEGDIIRSSYSINAQINKLSEIFSEKISDLSVQSEEKFDDLKLIYSWITIGIIFLLIFLSIQVMRNILYITNTLNKVIDKVKQGLLPDVPKTRRKDEIGELNSNLESMISNLKKLSAFANEIGKNKFDTKFQPASDVDVLGNALLQLRENLIKAQEETNIRQIENTQRNWASQGIAVFNEVIRDTSNNLEQLTNAVIEKLVNYTDSNIGGLYIINEDENNEKLLELAAFYAYDRHKYIQESVKPGETLIGQCYIENDTIYISEVPEDYISIVSGLGSDKPKSILIVPLQFNEITYGVVEIASFSEFEKYKIEFVEKISETIASAISTAKINERTTRLLEESNEKSKRLEQQEVQARENISKVQLQIKDLQEKYTISLDTNEMLAGEKDLIISQLEKLKKETKQQIEDEKQVFLSLQRAINQTMPYYEMNPNGDILYANPMYVQLLNLPEDEVFDHRHINFISRDFINSGNYKQIWDDLKENKKVNTSIQYMIDGKSKFINENLVPVKDKEDKFSKVFVFCNV